MKVILVSMIMMSLIIINVNAQSMRFVDYFNKLRMPMPRSVIVNSKLIDMKIASFKENHFEAYTCDTINDNIIFFYLGYRNSKYSKSLFITTDLYLNRIDSLTIHNTCKTCSDKSYYTEVVNEESDNSVFLVNYYLLQDDKNDGDPVKVIRYKINTNGKIQPLKDIR